MLTQILSGLLLSGAVSVLAWRFRTLSASGAAAALIVGWSIFAFGGLPWASLLLAFFISSSLLSRLGGQRKAALNEKFSKGSRRDWGQVLANGGLGAALALLSLSPAAGAWPWVAYAGAMAAVNADTWATELGVFSAALPRLITTGRRVERGASGGISPLGYLAALAGAALVGAIAALFPMVPHPWRLAGIAVLSGLAGSSFDSLLGASVQAIYFCPACNKETERHPRHTCGAPTHQVRGWAWLNNDWVNFLCSLTGALCALALSAWLL